MRSPPREASEGSVEMRYADRIDAGAANSSTVSSGTEATKSPAQ
jgi:hypothetical protein